MIEAVTAVPAVGWYLCLTGSVPIGFGFSIQTMIATTSSTSGTNQLNFFAAISFYSVMGNLTANLEERRWQQIATVIRNNGGAVVAEQMLPI